MCIFIFIVHECDTGPFFPTDYVVQRTRTPMLSHHCTYEPRTGLDNRQKKQHKQKVDIIPPLPRFVRTTAPTILNGCCPHTKQHMQHFEVLYVPSRRNCKNNIKTNQPYPLKESRSEGISNHREKSGGQRRIYVIPHYSPPPPPPGCCCSGVDLLPTTLKTSRAFRLLASSRSHTYPTAIRTVFPPNRLAITNPSSSSSLSLESSPPLPLDAQFNRCANVDANAQLCALYIYIYVRTHDE